MRIRRHTRPAFDFKAMREYLRELAGGRILLIGLGTVVGAFVIGYVVAALVIFPAPIFASEKTVPRLLDMDAEGARMALEALGLNTGDVATVNHPSAPRGAVVWQDPPPGVAVPERTSVAMEVSSGPQRIPVPDLAGYDVGLARTMLESAGLQVGALETTQAPLPKDVVIVTRPAAGTALTPESRVTLVVSLGAPTIVVPDIAGMSLEQVRFELEQAGLTLGTYFARTSFSGVPGTVIEQDPGAGTLTAPATAVNVILARRSP
jgi:serine/threonine-protein kinase